MMRLQKFLAESGITSRRKAEELIIKGKIKVNGEVIKRLGTKIDEIRDQIKYNDKIVKLKSNKIYLALNKPVGYISSVSNGQGKSILNLIKIKERIYPIGRLDKDSCGLMILTNDGEMANEITHPKFGKEKEYFVVLDQDLKSEDIKKLEKGMILAGKKLKPVKILSARNKSARLILCEGVNRQVRRMLGRLGYTVVKLKRVRIGKLELKNLKEGSWKKIIPSDI